MARQVKTLWIEVRPQEEEHEMKEVRAVLAGERAARTRYSFRSAESFLATLTPQRWALLQGLLGEEGLSLRALARKTGRDVRAVHADVHRLLAQGLLDKRDDGRLALPFGEVFDEIHVDFTVQANVAGLDAA